MVSQWPGNDEKALSKLINDGDEAAMTAIMESIKTIRALRLEVNAAPGKKSEVILNFTDESLRQVFALLYWLPQSLLLCWLLVLRSQKMLWPV